MKYGQEVNKVEVNKDVYAEQFSGPEDIETNYMVNICGEVVIEGEDPLLISTELRGMIDQLDKWERFFRKKAEFVSKSKRVAL